MLCCHQRPTLKCGQICFEKCRNKAYKLVVLVKNWAPHKYLIGKKSNNRTDRPQNTTTLCFLPYVSL